MSDYYLDARVAEAYDEETDGVGAVVVEDVPFYEALARDALRAGERVLELGCGTGRVTIPLALTGATVTGLDRSPEMLRLAKRKAEAAGAVVCWVEADMARFDLGGAFGLVVVPFRSLQLLTDDDDLNSCLEMAHRHLTPGGLLAFNIASSLLPRLLRRVIAPDEDAMPSVNISESGLAMRYFDASEIEEALQAAGFEIEGLYGWFDCRPFTDESSEMVWLARKRGG